MHHARLLPLIALLAQTRSSQPFVLYYSRQFSTSTTVVFARKRKTDDAFENQKRELNRRERMELILDRDGMDCVWCRSPLDVDTATTDHVIPRIKGGPSWISNEVATCRRCNKARGHARPLEWLGECKAKGWDPNEKAVDAKLRALDQAIQKRGGQRKARPYLARELRRIEKEGK